MSECHERRQIKAGPVSADAQPLRRLCHAIMGTCLALALVPFLPLAPVRAVAAAQNAESGAPRPEQPSNPISPTNPIRASRWSARLLLLAPSRPREYFELAEEVADSAASEEERRLARHLFGLAGALSGEQFGRSACLALADLADDPATRARFTTAAALLDRRGGVAPDFSQGSLGGASREGGVALSEMFSFYRRGLGPRVLKLLELPEVAAMLERYGRHLDGGADRFRSDARSYRGQARPALSASAVGNMLRIEVGVLAGRARPWSSDLLLDNDRPLTEVDLGRLDELLSVDPTRPIWRDGRWVAP